ncbi:MAG: lysophospholipid acyltransferase family protein [Magnetococcales bacterium]|nr:lysophospholipid acyltransferase family protein [Magnetococcales bacterium]
MASALTRPWPLRVRHRLEWLLLQTLLPWLQSGDLAQASRRAQRLARLLRWLLASEWRWAQNNLYLVYGDHLTPAERLRLAAMAMENMVLTHLDGLRQDPFSILNHDSEARTILQECLAQGRGAIICGVHLGSWEIGLKWFASLGFPIHVVYRHSNNPLSEQLFMAARAHYGVQWIRRDEPLKLLRALQKRHILVLMTDINQRRDGIPVPFLGTTALSPAGPARLAKRWQVPLLPLVCVREQTGQFRILNGPLLTANADEDEVALTARIYACCQPWIHHYAEQYNWLHARWRSRPDGSLWQRTISAEALAAARLTPPALPAERVHHLLNSRPDKPR